MIEKVLTFPNQAIPSIYGDSLSYTQQVAYLMYKVNECIDKINQFSTGSLPNFNPETMEAWTPQVVNGAVAWTPDLKTVTADMLTVKATQTAQGRKIDEIYDGLVELSAVLVAINEGEVE